MKKIIALLVAAVTLCLSLPALAQEASCPAGGFSLTLPDTFSAVSPMPRDQDLVFAWQGGGISVLGYATKMGAKVHFEDLFQVLTGNEVESGQLTIRKKDMLYARGTDSNGAYKLYSWLHKGMRIELYFYYDSSNRSALLDIDDIIHSLALN